MAMHKFEVGEHVGLLQRQLRMPSPGDFTILLRLPPAEGENQYRVKSAAEQFERVVRESDIVRR